MSVNPLTQHKTLTQLNRDLTTALDVERDEVDPEALPAQAELAMSIHARTEALVAKVAGGMDRSGIWADSHRTQAALLTKLVPNHRRNGVSASLRHG